MACGVGEEGSVRYLVGALLGIGAGVGTLWGIKGSGFGGSLESGLYSSMITYPAAVLAAAIVFWVVVAAMDPGSGH
jgi:hypothetical protein